MSRRIMFILDTSGSMIGTKIQQLKDAMMEILDDLQENDMFNIIEFNDKITRWSTDAPVKYATPEAISSSKEFINNLTADGCKYLKILMNEQRKKQNFKKYENDIHQQK
jgi:uncharacterized protein with von Willebrand factor type A (vWA) domain